MREFIFELLKGIKREGIDITLISQWFVFVGKTEHVLFTIEFKGDLNDLSLFSIFRVLKSKKQAEKTTATISVRRTELIEWYRNSHFSQYEQTLC